MMTKMKNKMEFNRKEQWDCNNFYVIYIENGEKYIRFLHGTDRADREKPYLSWIIEDYPPDCKMKLTDFTAWSTSYQMAKLLEDSSGAFEYEVEPQEAFNKANEFVKGIDGEGSDYLNICEIQDNTPCGNYYGA